MVFPRERVIDSLSMHHVISCFISSYDVDAVVCEDSTLETTWIGFWIAIPTMAMGLRAIRRTTYLQQDWAINMTRMDRDYAYVDAYTWAIDASSFLSMVDIRRGGCYVIWCWSHDVMPMRHVAMICMAFKKKICMQPQSLEAMGPWPLLVPIVPLRSFFVYEYGDMHMGVWFGPAYLCHLWYAHVLM